MRKALVLVIVSLLVVSCTSAPAPAPSPPTAAPAKATAAAPAPAPTTAAKPTAAPASRKPYVVGITVPIAANLAIKGVIDGLTAEVERDGGTVKVGDAQGKLAKQITDIEQFITQKVDVIIVWPMDWTSVRAAVQRAKEAGITVIGRDAVLDDSKLADLAPADFEVIAGRKEQAAEATEFIAKRTGGNAKIVGVTFCPNSVPLQYLFDQFKAQVAARSAMTLLDVVCNPSDDAAGAYPVLQRALTRFGEANAVYSYNDPTAIGAARAADAMGVRKNLVITGYNASPDGVDALKNGLIDATWDYNPIETGQTLARAVRMTLDGKASKLPKVVTVKSVLYTKENINQFVPWEQRLEQAKTGKYLGVPLE